MCIINEPADVSRTQIFVSPNQRGDRQFTCYSNAVMTDSENNVMILPVRRPDTVLFHDLSEYKEIFKDLEWSIKPPTFSLGPSSNDDNWVSVQDVGSYRVSLAMCYADLNRIDPREFGHVNPHIKAILGKYYCGQSSGCTQIRSISEWGFVICKLAPGKMHEYHPIAYSNAIRHNEPLFVPTRHQHNHSEMGDIVGLETEEEKVSDWDHAIYSLNTIGTSGSSVGEQAHKRNKFHLKREKIEDFQFPVNIVAFNKLRVKGQLPNRDYWFGIIC